jgi:hypothetical protein
MPPCPHPQKKNLGLELLSFHDSEKMSLLFKPPVCSILLQQLEQTHTDWFPAGLLRVLASGGFCLPHGGIITGYLFLLEARTLNQGMEGAAPFLGRGCLLLSRGRGGQG